MGIFVDEFCWWIEFGLGLVVYYEDVGVFNSGSGVLGVGDFVIGIFFRKFVG